MDEVRVSKVARSANWINLEYQNQKPLQTLVGPLVQTGSTFSVAPTAGDDERRRGHQPDRPGRRRSEDLLDLQERRRGNRARRRPVHLSAMQPAG